MSEPRYALPTDTRHVHFESRQYKLGIELGASGLRRIYLLVGVITGFVWVVFLRLAFGLNVLTWISLYIAPPLFLTMLACRKDIGGRYAYVTLFDRWRYIKRRHRPLVPTPGHPAQARSRVTRRVNRLIPAHRNRVRVYAPEFQVIDTTTLKGVAA